MVDALVVSQMVATTVESQTSGSYQEYAIACNYRRVDLRYCSCFFVITTCPLLGDVGRDMSEVMTLSTVRSGVSVTQIFELFDCLTDSTVSHLFFKNLFISSIKSRLSFPTNSPLPCTEKTVIMRVCPPSQTSIAPLLVPSHQVSE